MSLANSLRRPLTSNRRTAENARWAKERSISRCSQSPTTGSGETWNLGFETPQGCSGLNAACQTAFPDVSGDRIQSKTTSGEGNAVTVNSDSCTDAAGNTAAAKTSAAFKIDKTAPTITCGPTPTFYLGQPAPTLVTGTLSDTLSGPTSAQVSPPADTSLAAGGTVTLTGSDLAGNAAAPKSCPYNINRIVFKQPIDGNAINIAKSGRVVPIKVNVYTNNAENQVGPVTLGMPVAISCTSGLPADAVEEYAAGASNTGLSFRWDTTFWIYNFDTSSVKLNSCYNVNISLAGNLAGSFKIQITK